ncbi:MAG: ring-cleaving dioxygenase [Anaerolineae bacterium]|nr:ring-cleaving dioxygenase [Anaerolineae bacterium]
MQLHGLHHVTAVTGKVRNNLDFYTRILGLRLVKKTVNQDDTSAYHLFYADKVGSPGTDMTFFDWPQTGADQRGTDSISNTLFRVNGQAALDYWLNRFAEHNVKHEAQQTFAGRSILRFEDPEGQRLTLVDDGGADFHGQIWDGADVPAEFAIRGFYGVQLSVPALGQVGLILTQLLGFEETSRQPNPANPQEEVIIYSMDGGGPGKEVQVVIQPELGRAFLGSGGVHHVAFRVKDVAEQDYWNDLLTKRGLRTSGLVDRYYFQSLYFRISGGILFELATDGPGFATDEAVETLGERLALPPFLEPYREQIEKGLKPLDTVISQ